LWHFQKNILYKSHWFIPHIFCPHPLLSLCASKWGRISLHILKCDRMFACPVFKDVNQMTLIRNCLHVSFFFNCRGQKDFICR
jgi:hypothetical protein